MSMPHEPTLAATQSAFTDALWDQALPLALAAQFPDEAALRFAVYRNNVIHSLTRALAARFPVIERLVGAEFFAALARVFCAASPPRDPVLLHWGQDFPDFVAQFPPLAHLPYLACIARLEHARALACHAADAAPIAPEALRRADPATLRLGLHPALRLFTSPWPAVQIWGAQQPGARAEPLRPGPDHAVIARRPDFAVRPLP